jgi:hypothetical protein
MTLFLRVTYYEIGPRRLTKYNNLMCKCAPHRPPSVHRRIVMFFQFLRRFTNGTTYAICVKWFRSYLALETVKRFPVDGGQVVLQRAESVERRTAVGTSFRRTVSGRVAAGARRRRWPLVPVAVAAHGRRFFEPGQVIVHVHLHFDVWDERLSAYYARRGERHLAAVRVRRIAVLQEVLMELVLVVNNHFAVTTHGTRGYLRIGIRRMR